MAAGRAGLLDPGLVSALGLATARYGPSVAAPVGAVAIRHPDRIAIVDAAGEIDYATLRRRCDTLAAGLAELTVGTVGTVGILCRNHRGFVEANVTAAILGADVVYLNTGFAAPQLADVARREGVVAVFYDEEFAPVLAEADLGAASVMMWPDGTEAHDSASHWREVGTGRHVRASRRASQPVLLTSGTTGTPKGARRRLGAGDPLAALGLLERLPYRSGDTVVIGSPLFHAWGLASWLMTVATASTAVLIEQSDPRHVIETVRAHKADILVSVPTVLARILALPEEVLDADQPSSLRAVAVSGSALSGHLAERWMDRFGDSLYNLYGSTEVGQATLATPSDLRAAPGTAGRPLPGSTVRVLGDDGRTVATGCTGRVYVRSPFRFEGYTGGGDKDRIDGLLDTGDLGRFDRDGRLEVLGRADDMIVSGGENVFPREVEDLLATHPTVAEAAVVGIPDPAFGQRLRAVVVAAADSTVDGNELRAFVRSRLARYKVPRDVLVVDLLPRNAAGKVLREPLISLDPDGC
jgi:fatty-acyl-CoA synthase